MKLMDFVVPDAVLPSIEATERDDAVREMVEMLVQADAVPADLKETLIEQILEREKHGSTGFGKGVAVPHVKHEQVTEMAASVAVSQQGIEFNALDKQPVYCVFLLLSPKDKPEEHLQAMEVIFSNLQKDQFRRFLRQATSVDDVVDLLKEADAAQLSA